jgi:hypothetical protein
MAVFSLFRLTEARAQVPGCIDPPPTNPTIPYTSHDCVTLTIDAGCKIGVCYCSRLVGTIPDYYITSITPDPAFPCGSLSFDQLLGLANGKVGPIVARQYGVISGPCTPPWPDGYNQVQTTSATSLCWSLRNGFSPAGFPNYSYIACAGSTGYCTVSYVICYDPVFGYELAPISWSETPADCLSWEPNDRPWELNFCYQVNFPCPR